jgi:UDP-4-amino-4,6-dideoxy-N-acetyl-beta-L-altrosamine N-acetyltransferase
MVSEFEFKDFVDLSKDEHQLILSWRNHPEISRWMINEHVSPEEHTQFIGKLKSDNSRKYWLVFLDKEPIGTAYVTDITSVDAEIGLYMNPTQVGRGYGQRMLKAVLDLVCNSYTLKRLRLEVFETNVAAIHVYQKFGFKQIGTKQSQKGLELIMELDLTTHAVENR